MTLVFGKKSAKETCYYQAHETFLSSGRIVPLFEATWENLLKLAGVVAAVIGIYWAAIRAWYNSRFKAMDEKINGVSVSTHKRISSVERRNDQQDVRLNSHRDVIHKHDERFATLEVHVENGSRERQEIKDQVRKGFEKLDDKIEKLISRTG